MLVMAAYGMDLNPMPGAQDCLAHPASEEGGEEGGGEGGGGGVVLTWTGF